MDDIYPSLRFYISLAVGLALGAVRVLTPSTNVWFGSALSLSAFALLAYAFLLWSRFKLWREIWRWLMVAAAGLIFLVIVGKQIVSQYRLENPTVQNFDLHLSTSWLVAPLGLCVVLIVLSLLWITRQTSGKERTTADADEKARKEEELKQLSEALEKQTTETNKANEQYLEIVAQKQGVDDALIQSGAKVANLEQKLNVVQCQADDFKDQLEAHAELIKTAVDDNAGIKDLVTVCIVRTRTETEGGDPHIALTFHILNMSLRRVSVEGVEGSIRFTETDNYLRDRTLLREPITLRDKDNSAKDIPFRETGSFTIYQPLTERNINSMAPEGALLWLSDLEITIKADGCEPVRIPSGPAFIGKNRDWPSERAESYFIYRDAVRIEAKLRTLEAERDALKELVEKQPQKALPEDSEKK